MNVLVNPLQIILQNHTSWLRHFSRPDDSRERPSKQLDRKDGNLCYYFYEQTIFHCSSERNRMISMTTFSLIYFFSINLLLFVFDGQSYQKKLSYFCRSLRYQQVQVFVAPYQHRFESNLSQNHGPQSDFTGRNFFSVKTKT